MSPKPLQKIAVFGAGLAGSLCMTALLRLLPESIELVFIDTQDAEKTDAFYGTLAAPETYEFLLSMDLTEPDLIPHTNTAFSLGTHFTNWGINRRSWTQSFHRPLPIIQGVDFLHYLTRLRRTEPQLAAIEPYIISAHAAKRGVFAHPPEDRKTPLSNMEYGYHFLPEQWRALLCRRLQTSRVNYVKAQIRSVKPLGDDIHSVKLDEGTVITADLYIDAAGPQSKLAQSPTYTSTRNLKAAETFRPKAPLGSVCRILTSADYGWQSETSLQDGQHRLSIYDAASEDEALAAHGRIDGPPVKAMIGYTETPWQGNCLSLGHSAGVLEPLSPAPLILLQRDVERLIELIPVASDMSIEAHEYNRRFISDYSHASDFHRGLFEPQEGAAQKPSEPYWCAALAEPVSPRLANKMTQFESRGIGVQYDLEPFHKHDWMQQHLGMGRIPQRYDRLADRIPHAQLVETLHRIRGANAAIIQKMPPHDTYMAGLLKYLRKQHG